VLSTALPRRVAALLASAVVLTVASLSGNPAWAQEEDTDFEGGTKSLRETLDEAASAYQDAKLELEKLEKRELKLMVQLEELAEQREQVVSEIQVAAATAYRTGRVGAFTALLSANSPHSFLERVAAVDMLAKRENEQLARLRTLTEEVEARQAELAEVIAVQEKEVEKLEEAKKKAEAALFAIGGGANGNFEAWPAQDAKPAPRNSDGSFPAESCSEPDPTTSGCLTPRTLHALNEARLFGFVRYTACYRGGTFGEHPLGRACDFSTSPNGFGGVAYGEEKTYGDRLASFFVHNANALGVQYVIWYRQIWFPGTGWRVYGGGAGDPASDHTNHVHVSIR
jgi:prefoldin subunit 5